MKASLRWLREFVDLPEMEPARLSDAISSLGLEVESVEILEAPFTGVLVARVIAVEPHPSADRIRLATLDAGSGPVRVVCGAWNFGPGDLVAYAAVGSVLAGGLQVGEKEIRGISSPGMIASESELGLGDPAEGIMHLDAGEPGDDLAATLPFPDVIFDLAITPNRPDAMSMHGLARDLGAYFDLPVGLPDFSVEESGSPTEVTVQIDDPHRCPRFTARELRGVTVAPSPLWMRLRLRAVGLRPINNVVDVSNYVMMELGQPLHAFDLDRIEGDRVVVRGALPGETMRTLDGVDRSLTTEDLVVADAGGPIGLAGVMGGEETEVSESTSRVLLEVAHFEPAGVLLTGKRHGLRSEAVARFERGVDPTLPPIASGRATELLTRLAGANPAPALIDENPRPWSAPVVVLPAGEPERLLGVPVTPEQSADYLRRLGFGVTGEKDLEVQVPAFRPDVGRPADLVEEIARLHGFDNIPALLPFGRGGALPAEERAERLVRQVMVGAGYFEAWSFDFMAIEDLDALGIPADDERRRAVGVRNPLADDQRHLRTTLIPGLVRGVALNQARSLGEPPLFEIGAAFLKPTGVAELPHQPRRLGFVAAPSGGGEAADAVGVVAALFRQMHRRWDLDQRAVPGLHPGRSGRVVVDGDEVGIVGELHPSAAERFGVTGRLAVGEIDMSALTPLAPTFTAPSSFPPVVFDLAFDLEARVPAGRLLDAVRTAAGPLLEELRVFDVFSGSPLEAGRRSIAVRLVFRHPDRTLVEEELSEVRVAIAQRVGSDLGGRLRGA